MLANPLAHRHHRPPEDSPEVVTYFNCVSPYAFPMKTYRTIEKQAQLLGLPMTDLFALLFVMSLSIVFGIVLNFMIPMSKYYFWGVILLAGLGYLLLKRLNRQKHPSRMFSYLSYRCWQPRQVLIKSGRSNVKSNHVTNQTNS